MNDFDEPVENSEYKNIKRSLKKTKQRVKEVEKYDDLDHIDNYLEDNEE